MSDVIDTQLTILKQDARAPGFLDQTPRTLPLNYPFVHKLTRVPT
jgi:hypothetical protein